MRKLNVLFFITTLALGSGLLLACGDDDSGSSGNVTPPPQPPGPVNPPPVIPPPPPPPPPGPDASTFPGYVQDQIVNHTSDNGAPAPESAWGALPDDDKFAFPATFF
jgi:hypothetical protein